MKKEAMTEKRKVWLRVAATIFAIMALVHFLRLIFRFDFIIGSWEVPLWVSFVAFIIIGFLAIKLHNLTCWK